MIGAFIGGFIAGGLVTFILLVIMAICSLKSKERKVKKIMTRGVKCDKSPFNPYAKPFTFSDKPIVIDESKFKVDFLNTKKDGEE